MNNFLWVNIPNIHRTAQSRYITEIFPLFMKDFDIIIEIGTFTGAFTYYLSTISKEDCKIYSWDINEDYREINNIPKTELVIDNCFSPNSINKINSLVQTENRILFLCDGGDKELEFAMFSSYLKKDDVIMLHDYSESYEEYELIKNEIDWPTNSESHFSNIKKYIESNNLTPYYYDELKKVMWGSWIKS